VRFVRSVYYLDTLELIKYYLTIKVSTNAVMNIDKIRNLFNKNYSILWQEIMNEAKNCNLDLSIEGFQLLFRKIKTDMHN